MSNTTAAFFDLDKTIIATSSSTAFGRSFYAGGLLTRADALRTAYARLLFELGGADERQTNRLRDALSELVRGWDVERVNEIVAETLHHHIDPVVYEEALALIRRHQENGRDVVVVSASSAEMVGPIADLLGADHWIASQLEVEDGVYTGNVTYYAYGQAKADAITVLAQERGYDLRRSYAYSDSITDAPMLNVVGHGFAVNPNLAMRRAAMDNGWGVLNFRTPVALRTSRHVVPAVALTVTVVAAVVAGVVLYRHLRARDDSA